MSAYSPFQEGQLVFYWLVFGQRSIAPWEQIAFCFNCLFRQNRTKEALRKKFSQLARSYVKDYGDLQDRQKHDALAAHTCFHRECTLEFQLGVGQRIPIDLSRGSDHFFLTVSLVLDLDPDSQGTRKIHYKIPELERTGEFTERDGFENFQANCYSHSSPYVEIWELPRV
jgi:hypothetical protein